MVDYSVAGVGDVNQDGAAENGIVGLAYFLWFIVMYLREALRGMKSKLLFVSNVSSGLFASLMGLLLASYPGPDYFAEHAVEINVWALAGISVVVNRIDRQVKAAMKKKKMQAIKAQPQFEKQIIGLKNNNMNIQNL